MGGRLFEPHSQGLSSSRPLEMGRRETLGTRFRLFVNEIWGAYIRKADLNFFGGANDHVKQDPVTNCRVCCQLL